MKDGQIEKIQSRGYWRINFQPIVLSEEIKSLGECFELVDKSAVNLRGWHYPHVPNRNDHDTGLEPCNGYYQAWVDWSNHKEFWRMYQSGQFLHYLGLREDWLDEDIWRNQLAEEIKPMTSLNVMTTVYQMTEILVFLERLLSDGLYEEGVNTEISLKKTKNRRLWISDPLRGSFFEPKVTGAESIDYFKTYEASEAIGNSRTLALDTVLFFFDHFGWHNPSIESIKQDQENFLAQKM